MSTINQSLGPFRGLWSATDGECPIGFAGSILNTRVGDGHLRPRYGFRNVASMPGGFIAAWGFERLLGYGTDFLPQLEWVSLENRSGTVKPYSMDPTTYVRTEITDGGSALSLPASDWLGFSFGFTSYWVNPGQTISLYKHEVGNDTSWTALQNSAYVPTPADPTITATLNGGGQRLFDAGDTFVDTGTHDTITGRSYVVRSDGGLDVHGDTNDQHKIGALVVAVTPAATLDWTGAQYIAFECLAGNAMKYFELGCTFEIMVGGVWSTPTQQCTVASDRHSVAINVRLKGLTITAIQAYRITIMCWPETSGSGVACTFLPVLLGGTYIGATISTHRPWLGTYDTADTTYGVRFRNLSTPATTGVKGAVPIGAGRFGTLSLGPSFPVGDIVSVAATPDVTSPYFDDPSGATCVMDFVRLDQTGVWRLLGTFPNTVGQSIRDPYEENELSALTVVPAGGYTPPTTAPVFDDTGFVGGVPFKGWVVWFRAGGESNVQHSRVGNPEALASPGDDPDDLARGATFTLADNFADEPLGGVQAGDALLILGRQGVYGQAGNSPSAMTPPRKLPGSMGCAGRYSFARFYDENGNPGVAWVDPSGDNVWFASAGLVYSTDTQARPVEISQPIRNSLRKYLYSDQLAILPTVSVSDIRMDVDDATGSLWISLGQRAALLRPQSLLDGRRQWELSLFDLGQGGSVPIPACSDPYGTQSFTDDARGGSTISWANPSFAQPGTDVATASGFTRNLSSHWLHGVGFIPSSLLPAEATVTGTTLVIRHRATSTGAHPSPVNLSALVSGALSLTPAHAVPSSFENYSVDLSALALDVATVNAGIDVKIAYDAFTGTAVDLNPAHWSIVISPSGSQSAANRGTLSATQAFTVTATYTGGGTPPPFVSISLNGSATGSGMGGYISGTSGPRYTTGYTGTATVDDGLGQTASGSIAVPTPDPPPESIIASGTGSIFATVVSGSATGTVTMTANVSVSPNTTQDATASFTLSFASITPLDYDPSSIEVESLLLTVCYTVPVASGERAIQYLSFGLRSEGLLWIRSSGQIDAAEWCPTCERYVQGTNRDGGLPMPEGYWESGRLSSVTRRLSRIELERDAMETLTVSDRTERLTGGESHVLQDGTRWVRFSPRAQGRTHFIKLSVPETLSGVESIDMTFFRTDGPTR